MRIFLGLLVAAFFTPSALAGPDPAREVTVRGRIVCVDEARKEIPCPPANPRFALRTNRGEHYYFLSQDPKSKMFIDPRVRSRELEVKAWERADREVEIIKVFSIQEGRRFDLHYFCETCNIRAYAGGPCWCCQEDFELRETPLQAP